MADETRVVIEPTAIRKDGEHVVTVAEGVGKGVCLQFNGPASGAVAAVADGENGHAWFIGRDTAERLIAAMQKHLANG